MKKSIVLLTAAVVAGVSSLKAQDGLSVSATFAWESAYVFRGVQLAEEYFAPSVDVSYNGFYAGLWAALPVDHIYDNEVDMYGGYSLKVADAVSADFGFTYYTYPDRQKDFFDSNVNSFEIYAGVSFELPLSPSLYVFYDLDLENLTLEASVGHSIAVADKTAVDLGAHLGVVNVDGGGDYYYGGLSTGLTYSFTDSANISLKASWVLNERYDALDLKRGVARDDNKLFFGVSFTAGF
jgi:uncharacterized protein (TIGR02001 family)